MGEGEAKAWALGSLAWRVRREKEPALEAHEACPGRWRSARVVVGVSEAKSEGGNNGHAGAALQQTTWGPWGAGARWVLGRVNGIHFIEGRGEWEEQEGRQDVVNSSWKSGEEEKKQGGGWWQKSPRKPLRKAQACPRRPPPSALRGGGLRNSSSGQNQLSSSMPG